MGKIVQLMASVSIMIFSCFGQENPSLGPTDYSWIERLALVENLFEPLYKRAQEESTDKKTRREALRYYNFIRNQYYSKPAKCFSKIDTTWYNNATYHRLVLEWVGTISNIQGMPIKEFLLNLSKMLSATHTNSFNIEGFNLSEEIALHVYNLLRRWDNQKEVNLLSDIDMEWFIGNFDRFVKEVEQFESHPVSNRLLNLILLIQQKLNYDKGLIVASGSEMRVMGHARKEIGTNLAQDFSAISIDEIPDLDLLKWTLYHEFGHLFVDFLTDLLEEKIIYLNHPAIQNDSERIEKYIRIGKKSFDMSTAIGKKVLEILEHHDSFWDYSSLDEAQLIGMKYQRSCEQRADLFSLDNLLKHNELNALLAGLCNFADTDYIVVIGDSDVHPSNFERALYFAGFLVDHGVDLNAELKKFEEIGQCIDIDGTISDKSPFDKKARRVHKAVQQAYDKANGK